MTPDIGAHLVLLEWANEDLSHAQAVLRRRIVAAAKDGVPRDAIASAAGVSVPTVYRIFSDSRKQKASAS